MKIKIKISLPTHLKNFKRAAIKAIEEGCIQDIEFSGPTYQVLVKDAELGESFWVFIQLDGKSELQDGFCSCEQNSHSEGCLHLAIAYLGLFGSYELPLHQRFSKSIWYSLCRFYESRLRGDRQNLIPVSHGCYTSYSKLGKTILNLQATTAEAIEKLDKIILQEKIETEETSLKFSNLSDEELMLWKGGEPSSQLRFDLSYWSDLAKWLLAKQENDEDYQFTFNYSKKNIPNWIQVKFSDLEAGFYVSEANLPLFIESLSTVQTPLKVCYADDHKIESIRYKKDEHALIVQGSQVLTTPSQEDRDAQEESLQIGVWTYIPRKGFYARESHELLKHPLIQGRDIAFALTEHTRLIASLIEGCSVSVEPIPLSYSFHFDFQRNLHIDAYLFEPGDLQKGDSWLIEGWAYLDDEGFYAVENNRFDEGSTVISASRVSEFVTHNRLWLNHVEGFQTHVRSIDYQVAYQVNENRRLIFLKDLSSFLDAAVQYDFGAWVYVEGSGFYAKSAGFFGDLLRPGVSFSAEQIPLFIRMNEEELALIPRFFCERCPVMQSGLYIELVEKNKVRVRPQYRMFPEFETALPIFFDEFIYIQGQGFYELPFNLRLPEKYQQETELEAEALALFLTFELEALLPLTFFVDPRLLPPQKCSLVTDFVEPFPAKGRGWYQFCFFYETEKGKIPLSSLKKGVNTQSLFSFSESGRFDLKDKRYDWWRLLEKGRFDLENNKVVLSTLDFMKINAYDPISLSQGNEPSQLLFEQLVNLETPSKIDLKGLVSDLRPYQEMGVHWLWFLYTQHLSGLLCDDMGLGKTHQAMALLSGITNFYKSFAEGSPVHFLVVCPTSVIYHWQEKLAYFLPGANVLTYYGTSRDLDLFTGNFQVLLTSYGVLRNEKEKISEISFEVAIFDEIQVAKNQFSLTYAALKEVQSQMKLGLTGTPIENHLRELKSLFDIILPGYMPGDQVFRDNFVRPIEKEQSLEKQALLNRLIYPFTLRRKKEEVLKELPEKIEEVAYSDLAPLQATLYAQVLETKRRHLLDELRDEHASVPYLHVFSLLSILKQICDHPAVYYKQPQDYQLYSSGKWELFLELLREARESRQKVVVFSQYLGMLDIIEAYLKEHKIGFASLRGATKDRKNQLNLFHEDPNCEVFVGSLHAAGLGIDLTPASIVIHYDRWWNAARENQATDRVHRMGQTRGVQVFKLVTKGTFEEKIDEMIKRKGRLMESVVPADQHNAFKSFSREELMDLLS